MNNHPNRSKKKRKTAGLSSTPRKKGPSASNIPRHDHDREYQGLLDGVWKTFQRAADERTPFFVTDAPELNHLYLRKLPSERQVHDCTACRHFIERFGSLVTIDEVGRQHAVMWHPDDVPAFYKPAFGAMKRRVEKAAVTDVFRTPQRNWGTPRTGVWAHMAVQAVPKHLVYHEGRLNAGQAMAEARENVKTVTRALIEFTPAMLDTAISLFEGEHLNRSEKFVAPLRWLRALHTLPPILSPAGHNLLWRAVATAPEGYCHPRSSVIGPLLEGIAAGTPFATLKKQFAAMTAPLAYQRPQAAPAAGNVAAAEKLVEKLGIAPALHRRFARFDEIVPHVVWIPSSKRHYSPGIRPAPSPGVFSHVLPKALPPSPGYALPRKNITWDKFQREVMPSAGRIEIMLGSNAALIGLVSAVNEDAPPILKWDREEERNPVSWYVYPGGTRPMQWGVKAGVWLPVTAVVPLPTLWGSRPQPHLGEGAIFVIENCVDSQGNAAMLFPEILRSDLHSVRSTIEAHSRSARLSGREHAGACGFDLRKQEKVHPATVRTTTPAGSAEYLIDRWD